MHLFVGGYHRSLGRRAYLGGDGIHGTDRRHRDSRGDNGPLDIPADEENRTC